MTKPKLICFDLWETLVTESSSTESHWEPLTVQYPEIEWSALHLVMKNIIHKKDQSTEASVREIMGTFGVQDEAMALEISRRWDSSCNQTTIFPNTYAALECTKKLDYKLGLITNTSRHGWDVVERKFALSKYFDYLAVSYEVHQVKPEPEIFQYIERIFGLDGANILMIGDSYKSDFVAAKNAGWQAILLDISKTNDRVDAQPVIHDLAELKNLLQ